MNIELLKAEATDLGIGFSPNIGLETLKQKITEFKINQESQVVESTAQRRVRRVKEATLMRRVRITCLNPNKLKEKTVLVMGANSLIGTHKAYVPLNTVWHCTQIHINIIKEKKYLVLGGIGNTKVETLPEYSVEILPEITSEELEALKKEQTSKANLANL